jgi:hypothetical protein
MITSTERIDQLALVWLLVPRKKNGATELAQQLKDVGKGADDRRRLAGECIARLRGRGMVQPGRRLELTEAGRNKALESLGVSRIPASKTAWQWAKKVLLLRSLGVEPTPGAINTVSRADVLAARIVARRNRLDRKLETSATQVLAVLARRALGLEDAPSFKFHDAFSAVFLAGTPEPESLRLAECELPEFASRVTDAARSSNTGRWHDAVFISHVWNTLRGRGDVGISFEKFKRRLIEAYQSDLLDLSRADLVDAMPAADVSASETVHSGARFHFVRVEQLAS